MYEFCDVYLELLKPRLHGEAANEDEEADRHVARQVLYICLDWSMRLMHPLLPYLTEELYQRLPPTPSKCQSICIAPYPKHVIAWANDAVEREMEVVSEIAKHFRSQKTSLGLGPGARPKGFVRHNDQAWSQKLHRLESRISRMGQIGEVKVLDESAAVPPGSLRDVVNEKCLIFMEVMGLDLSQELAKLQKKVASAEKMVASYEAKITAPGYEEKVPANVREMNAQKLEASRAELEELTCAVASIKEAMAA